METSTRTHHLFRPLEPEQLVSAQGFYAIPHGQLIFYHEAWDCFVLTTISPEVDYNVDDYLLLPEGAPYQLIAGKLVYMAAPKSSHQFVSQQINQALFNFVSQYRLGRVFYAPVDVVLGDDSVVQPDIFFVSIKRRHLMEAKMQGAPDLVVEILSSNAAYDRGLKYQLYEQHGVLEYWIVDTEARQIEVFAHNQTQFELLQTATATDVLHSKVLTGLELPLANIFDEEW